MTDDNNELYNKLERTGHTMEVFHAEALRLNSQLYELGPGSREHRQKQMEVDVAIADWRQYRQAFQELQRDIDQSEHVREGLVRGRGRNRGPQEEHHTEREQPRPGESLTLDRRLDEADREQDRLLGRERER